MSIKTKVLNIHTHIHLFWLMAFVCLCSMAFYMYFINQTIHNVASRGVFEQELSERTSRIGELEFTYIAQSNKIDLALARDLGFEEANPSAFVSRKQSVAFNQTSPSSR